VAPPSTACKGSRAYCFCQGKASGSTFADTAKGCTYYFQCVTAASYDRPCNAGLLWDETLSVCNWPNQVKCASA
jgi:hypothetical protein